MTTGSEPAWIARFLENLKELPVWVLTALSVALCTYLLFPKLSGDLPSSQRSWLILGAVVFTSLAFSRWISLIWHAWISRAEKANVRRTFRLILIDNSYFWSASKQSDDSYVTQLCADFRVKNRTERSLELTSVRIIPPLLHSRWQRGKSLQRMLSLFHGGTKIPAGEIEAIRITIMLHGKPNQKPGDSIKVVLAISDEDGNEQRVRLKLPSLARPQSTEPLPKLEMPSRITDHIVKGVASILQSELTRYDNCGRRVGGLGSVHLVLNGNPMRGVGGDSWTPDVPKKQSIQELSENAILSSDNLDSMLALYGSLSFDEERSRFAAALYDRLCPDKGYLRIAYFIFLTLWKVDLFSDALDVAKRSLPQGETRDFGLSNVLMLLNGLLRYQHEIFTGEMLDEIEEFMDGLNEHTFLVAEKIMAIRAKRLRSAVRQ